ncbi:hypothetical protein D048_1010B, partial [Vibrio parahaemolyticus VPTS-2009]
RFAQLVGELGRLRQDR